MIHQIIKQVEIMEMTTTENYMDFGIESEHLSDIITDQIMFNSSLDAKALYDEIKDKLLSYPASGILFVADLHTICHKVESIERTANFQFFKYRDKNKIGVANKFF